MRIRRITSGVSSAASPTRSCPTRSQNSHTTPKAAAPVIVWLFGVVWLFWLRVGFLILFTMYGIAPKAA